MTIVDGVRLVSNSEVQTFKDCPRRWWLAWYRGLTPRTANVESPAATGTRVHQALAAYYVPEGQRPADPLVTLQHVQDEDLAVLDARHDPLAESNGDNLVTIRDDLLKQFDLEQAMISGYLEWLTRTGEDADIEVIEPEAYVEAKLPRLYDDGLEPIEIFGTDVKLVGKIDARVRSRVTNRRKFIDHKTVGSLHDPMLGLNQQMLHYHLIEFLNTDGADQRCDGALYNMLRKVKRTRASKPPYFARVPIDHNIHELTNYLWQLGGTIANIVEIESLLEQSPHPHQAVVPSRPSRDCVWKCDFFKICRMFDDGSRVEDAVEALYVRRDPLDYYGGRHLDHE